MSSNGAWNRIRLGSIVTDAVSGFASSSRDASGIIQLRTNNIGIHGDLDLSETLRVPRNGVDLERFGVRLGDVLFNNTNSQELVGKTAFVEKLFEPLTFSNHLTRLRFDARQINARFAAMWLQYKWSELFFFDNCIRWIGQAAFQSDRLLELDLPLPPVDEQKRITEQLRSGISHVVGVTDSIAQRFALMDQMRRAILFEAFGGIRPLGIDKKEEKRAAGWQWVSLGEIARLESGHTPSRRHPEWWNGDIPWLALPDIRLADGKEIFDTVEKTNHLGLQNSSARLLPSRTVAMSRTASVAFVAVMGRPMATSQDFVNWVCGPELDPWFLAWALIASRSYLLELASGAIHKTIYMPTVEAFRICAPPIAEQKRIVQSIRQRLDCLDRAVADLDKERREAEKLEPALLRAAFTGQL